jgi:protein-disulfide isomerase-like protein with CxxC motif
VEHYDFEVLEGDKAIAAVWSVALQNPKAIWPRIADLAREVYAPGRKIRVTNQLGEMVILIGVAAALRCASSFGAS